MYTTVEIIDYLMKNPLSANILGILMNKGMSDPELMTQLKIDKSTLDEAIRGLSKYGLVYHGYRRKGRGVQIRNTMTPIGRKIFPLYEDAKREGKVIEQPSVV